MYPKTVNYSAFFWLNAVTVSKTINASEVFANTWKILMSKTHISKPLILKEPRCE
jgi:hypothetical protein